MVIVTYVATFLFCFAFVSFFCLFGNLKFPLDVNGCLFLFVSPVSHWRPVQGVPPTL